MEVVLFQSAQLYTTTLQVLRRNLERARNGYVSVGVWAREREDGLLHLRLNRHTLYIEAFHPRDGAPWYVFKDCIPQAGDVVLNLSTQHRDLGTTSRRIPFTDATRFSIDSLKYYEDGPTNTIVDPLGYLVVAISEAVRFPAIEKNIADSLMGLIKYNPTQDHTNLMSNWHSKSKERSPDVALPAL